LNRVPEYRSNTKAKAVMIRPNIAHGRCLTRPISEATNQKGEINRTITPKNGS